MSLTPSPTADFLILAILGLIGGHVALLHVQRRWLAFDPLNAFWAGVLVCYIGQPIRHAHHLEAWHEVGTLERTLFWILFGLLSVVIGYEARIGARWAVIVPSLPARLDPKRLMIFAVSLVIVGIAGYAYMMASAGGASRWLAVGRGATDWVNVSAYIAMLPVFLPVGVSLMLFHVEFHRASVLNRAIAWGLAATLWMWFLYLGTRSRTIEMTLLMLAAWYIPQRRNPRSIVLAGVFIGLLAVTSFQTRYREQFTNLSFNLDKIEAKQAPLGDSFAPDSGSAPDRGLEFNCVMTVVELVPTTVDYNYGYGLLEFATRPIPRALWAEKPYPGLEAVFPIMKQGELSSTYVATSAKPLLMGPALTFVGYWYAAGGAVALAIAGFLTGCLLRMIRTIYDGAPGSESHAILYTFLLSIGFLEAASTPLAWAFTLPLILIPLVIMLRSSGAKAAAAPGSAS